MTDKSTTIKAAQSAQGQVVFVWGVSQKAQAYPQIRRMFGAREVIFMAPGSTIEVLTDEALAKVGLQRIPAPESGTPPCST
jgi:hypothetical protein